PQSFLPASCRPSGRTCPSHPAHRACLPAGQSAPPLPASSVPRSLHPATECLRLSCQFLRPITSRLCRACFGCGLECLHVLEVRRGVNLLRLDTRFLSLGLIELGRRLVLDRLADRLAQLRHRRLLLKLLLLRIARQQLFPILDEVRRERRVIQ